MSCNWTDKLTHIFKQLYHMLIYKYIYKYVYLFIYKQILLDDGECCTYGTSESINLLCMLVFFKYLTNIYVQHLKQGTNVHWANMSSRFSLCMIGRVFEATKLFSLMKPSTNLYWSLCCTNCYLLRTLHVSRAIIVRKLLEI